MSLVKLRDALLVVRKHTIGYTEAQTKIIAATTDYPDAGVPFVSITQRFELAQLSFQEDSFEEITEILTKRLNDSFKWRRVVKALTILHYCLQEGSPKFEIYCRVNQDLIRSLENFRYSFEDETDKGILVRKEARKLLVLLDDPVNLGRIHNHAATIRRQHSKPKTDIKLSIRRRLTRYRKSRSQEQTKKEREDFDLDGIGPVSIPQKIRSVISGDFPLEFTIEECKDIAQQITNPGDFMVVLESFVESLAADNQRQCWTHVFKAMVLLRICLDNVSQEVTSELGGDPQTVEILERFGAHWVGGRTPLVGNTESPSNSIPLGDPSALQGTDGEMSYNFVSEEEQLMETRTQLPSYSLAVCRQGQGEANAAGEILSAMDSKRSPHFLVINENYEFDTVKRHHPGGLRPPTYGCTTMIPECHDNGAITTTGDSKQFLGTSSATFPLSVTQGLNSSAPSRPLPLPPTVWARLHRTSFGTGGVGGDITGIQDLKVPLRASQNSSTNSASHSIRPLPILGSIRLDHNSDPELPPYSAGGHTLNMMANTFTTEPLPITPQVLVIGSHPLSDLEPDLTNDQVPGPPPRPNTALSCSDRPRDVIEALESNKPLTNVAFIMPHRLGDNFTVKTVPNAADAYFDPSDGNMHLVGGELDGGASVPLESSPAVPVRTTGLNDDRTDTSSDEGSIPMSHSAKSYGHSRPPLAKLFIPAPADRVRSASTSSPLHSAINLAGQIELQDGPVAYGGFSDIFRGKLISNDGCSEDVCLKSLRAVKMRTKGNTNCAARLEQRMHREMRVWQRLDHPNVVPLRGYLLDNQNDGNPALVCPWYANRNILEYLARNPFADRKKLVRQVAQGLIHLHAQSSPIVHGDIKGGNVLIDSEGNAALADFGLSQILQECPINSASSATAGSVRWSAPEVLLSDSYERTLASDVWAFGVLTLEILTGRVPYHNMKNEARVINCITSGQVLERKDYPELPNNNRFWEVLEACWKMSPDDRPTMDQLASRILDDDAFSQEEEGI